MNLIPTILCGGAGSRLWPISRESHPKPFIRLADGQSLIQKAFLRSAQLFNVNEILTVTNKSLYLKAQEEFKAVNSTNMATSFILEPYGRNTAPAITAAALQVAQTWGAEAVLLILTADHLISNQTAFQQAVSQAIELAQQQKLVTFGIRPTHPETGFGYINFQDNKVLQFIEKPTLQHAIEFVSSGHYLWNSGMFCFSVKTFLAQMEVYCPEIVSSTKACFPSSRLPGPVELDSTLFRQVPENSIDYALMEKAENIAVVPCAFSWSDVGTWDSLSNLITADENNNRLEGDIYLHEVNNCYIKSEHRVVGAVGISDLTIIDTDDALLITNNKKTQQVKNIYQMLKDNDHEAHKLHRTVFRPWGTYTILEEGEGFKIKRLVVNPGASLSLQMHQYRSEHWVVVSGTATVTNAEQQLTLQTNESTYIPAGNKHRLENRTQVPVIIIEVQSGEYVGEDDIIRFEDKYGRVVEV